MLVILYYGDNLDLTSPYDYIWWMLLDSTAIHVAIHLADNQVHVQANNKSSFNGQCGLCNGSV